MTTITEVTDEMTLAQAKEILRKHLDKGANCPCCKQPVKMYRRPLTSAMALGLLLLYKDNKTYESQGDQWYHLENFFKAIPDLPSSVRGDVPKLRFWGLIRAKEGGKDDGNPSNGLYQLTSSGKAFSQGIIKLSSHVKLYNNKFFGLSGNEINIHQALGTKFNYDQIINGK